jgi:hypothetical protein
MCLKSRYQNFVKILSDAHLLFLCEDRRTVRTILRMMEELKTVSVAYGLLQSIELNRHSVGCLQQLHADTASLNQNIWFGVEVCERSTCTCNASINPAG